MPVSVVVVVVGVTNRLLDKCVHLMIFRYFLLTFVDKGVHLMIFRYFLLTFVDNVIRFGSAMRMFTALLTVFF